VAVLSQFLDISNFNCDEFITTFQLRRDRRDLSTRIVTFWLPPALFFVNALLMHSSVRTDESLEKARLEKRSEDPEKEKAQARRIVTELNVLGVGRWELGKSSCHSNRTQRTMASS
jgi:hypothetical protein